MGARNVPSPGGLRSLRSDDFHRILRFADCHGLLHDVRYARMDVALLISAARRLRIAVERQHNLKAALCDEMKFRCGKLPVLVELGRRLDEERAAEIDARLNGVESHNLGEEISMWVGISIETLFRVYATCRHLVTFRTLNYHFRYSLSPRGPLSVFMFGGAGAGGYAEKAVSSIFDYLSFIEPPVDEWRRFLPRDTLLRPDRSQDMGLLVFLPVDE